jgi:hypothetical protein
MSQQISVKTPIIIFHAKLFGGSPVPFMQTHTYDDDEAAS